MTLTVGSVFSGIGGFEEGFRRAGAETVFSCEVDQRCRDVLRRHFPGVPRVKDIKELRGSDLRAVGAVPDVLVGGFPCTDVSVAGRRAGLAGPQSGLFYEFARLLEEAQPEWFIIENVPGLLSSAGGRDMGAILWILAELGYMGAWRVLDAQWFGVAQRRRRVFIVGHLGDGARARQVLLDPEGGGGDPPARRAQVSGVAPGAGSGATGDGGTVATLQGGGQRGYRVDAEGAAGGHLVPAVAYGLAENQRAEVLMTEEYLRQITAGGGKPGQGYPAVMTPELAVRRLTPEECEALQGFPRGWTSGQPDSVRYRQLGNAVCVPVVEWLARRMVEASR